MVELKSNVELFQRIKRHILEEPRRFSMASWGIVFSAEDTAAYDLLPCGIAGILGE